MDGTDERPSSPQESARTRRALERDWSEGLPGPVHAHGLPTPEPLAVPARDEAAPSPVPVAAAESAAEPAVEAPADWGVAPDPSVEAVSGAESDDDFPVTLSEADEIQEETTAPVDLGPFEDTAVEQMPAEEALAQMEAASAPVDAAPDDAEAALPEAAPPEEGPLAEFAAPPAEFEPAPEAALTEAAGTAADWLAHPDSTEAAAPAVATWEEATFATESTMDSAFAAAEDAVPAEADVDISFADAPADAPPSDAWGEPTVAAEGGNPDIEAWAAPVETPIEVPPAPPAQGLSAASQFVDMPPPKEGGELTEEPPEPQWSQGPRELFSPLPKGASLSDEDVTSQAALSVDSGSSDRAPPQLELVRGPETLEDPDLLGICLSGAGPSIVALATQGFDRLAARLEKLYADRGSVVTIRNVSAEPSRAAAPVLASRGRS